MNEIQVHETQIEEPTPLTAPQVKAQVQLIQQVMQAVMKDKIHYGTIPGCGDKPALLKPGAEKLFQTFRIADDPAVEDLSGPDEIRYRIKTKAYSGGKFLGSGLGECSSLEEKYKWRRAVCNEEWDETPEDRRRQKWVRGFGDKPNFQVKQVRTNGSDVANTVLKMADKRACVAVCLKVTAASDIFTQDLEEMEPELAESIAGGNGKAAAPPIAQPQRKSEAAPAAPANGNGHKAVDREGMKPMSAKFAGKCAECQGAIAAGEMVFYDATAKKVYHHGECGYVPA